MNQKKMLTVTAVRGLVYIRKIQCSEKFCKCLMLSKDIGGVYRFLLAESLHCVWRDKNKHATITWQYKADGTKEPGTIDLMLRNFQGQWISERPE